MRERTLLLLVVVIVLVAVYGAFQVLKVLAAVLLAVVLAFALATFVVVYRLRRRMRRSVRLLQESLRAAQAHRAGRARPGGPDVIDVEAREEPDAPSR
ncbi:MAG TPA: hypothetical protein VHI93_08180 [Candidatus Thermoplasmatota archaeon]|nr:hypothetical protein [Candidatus Thermoplasmatota archaeon]